MSVNWRHFISIQEKETNSQKEDEWQKLKRATAGFFCEFYNGSESKTLSFFTKPFLFLTINVCYVFQLVGCFFLMLDLHEHTDKPLIGDFFRFVLLDARSSSFVLALFILQYSVFCAFLFDIVVQFLRFRKSTVKVALKRRLLLGDFFSLFFGPGSFGVMLVTLRHGRFLLMRGDEGFGLSTGQGIFLFSLTVVPLFLLFAFFGVLFNMMVFSSNPRSSSLISCVHNRDMAGQFLSRIVTAVVLFICTSFNLSKTAKVIIVVFALTNGLAIVVKQGFMLIYFNIWSNQVVSVGCGCVIYMGGFLIAMSYSSADYALTYWAISILFSPFVIILLAKIPVMRQKRIEKEFHYALKMMGTEGVKGAASWLCHQQKLRSSMSILLRMWLTDTSSASVKLMDEVLAQQSVQSFSVLKQPKWYHALGIGKKSGSLGQLKANPSKKKKYKSLPLSVIEARVMNIFFMVFAKNQPNEALRGLKKLSENRYSFAVDIMLSIEIAHMTRNHELNKALGESSSVFQKEFHRIKRIEDYTLRQMVIFWETLEKEEVDKSKLLPLANRILHCREECQKRYENLVHEFPESSLLSHSYLHFLENIVFDYDGVATLQAHLKAREEHDDKHGQPEFNLSVKAKEPSAVKQGKTSFLKSEEAGNTGRCKSVNLRMSRNQLHPHYDHDHEKSMGNKNRKNSTDNGRNGHTQEFALEEVNVEGRENSYQQKPYQLTPVGLEVTRQNANNHVSSVESLKTATENRNKKSVHISNRIESMLDGHSQGKQTQDYSHITPLDSSSSNEPNAQRPSTGGGGRNPENIRAMSTNSMAAGGGRSSQRNSDRSSAPKQTTDTKPLKVYPPAVIPTPPFYDSDSSQDMSMGPSEKLPLNSNRSSAESKSGDVVETNEEVNLLQEKIFGQSEGILGVQAAELSCQNYSEYEHFNDTNPYAEKGAYDPNDADLLSNCSSFSDNDKSSSGFASSSSLTGTSATASTDISNYMHNFGDSANEHSIEHNPMRRENNKRFSHILIKVFTLVALIIAMQAVVCVLAYTSSEGITHSYEYLTLSLRAQNALVGLATELYHLMLYAPNPVPSVLVQQPELDYWGVNNSYDLYRKRTLHELDNLQLSVYELYDEFSSGDMPEEIGQHFKHVDVQLIETFWDGTSNETETIVEPITILGALMNVIQHTNIIIDRGIDGNAAKYTELEFDTSYRFVIDNSFRMLNDGAEGLQEALNEVIRSSFAYTGKQFDLNQIILLSTMFGETLIIIMLTLCVANPSKWKAIKRFHHILSLFEVIPKADATTNKKQVLCKMSQESRESVVELKPGTVSGSDSEGLFYSSNTEDEDGEKKTAQSAATLSNVDMGKIRFKLPHHYYYTTLLVIMLLVGIQMMAILSFRSQRSRPNYEIYAGKRLTLAHLMHVISTDLSYKLWGGWVEFDAVLEALEDYCEELEIFNNLLLYGDPESGTQGAISVYHLFEVAQEKTCFNYKHDFLCLEDDLTYNYSYFNFTGLSDLTSQYLRRIRMLVESSTSTYSSAMDIMICHLMDTFELSEGLQYVMQKIGADNHSQVKFIQEWYMFLSVCYSGMVIVLLGVSFYYLSVAIKTEENKLIDLLLMIPPQTVNKVPPLYTFRTTGYLSFSSIQNTLTDSLANTRKEAATVMNSVCDGLFVCTKDGHIVNCNTAATDLTDLPREDIIGAPLINLMETSDRKSYKKMWETYQKTGTAAFVRQDAERVLIVKGTVNTGKMEAEHKEQKRKNDEEKDGKLDEEQVEEESKALVVARHDPTKFVSCLLQITEYVNDGQVLFVASLKDMTSEDRKTEERRQELVQLVDDRTKDLLSEKEKSQAVLFNMLPREIAIRLLRGEDVEPVVYNNVTIFFSDVVGFTNLSQAHNPVEVMTMLDEMWSVFDRTAEANHVHKVETIGDAFEGVGGCPEEREDHAELVADFACEILEEMADFKMTDGTPIRIRIGLNSGPVVTGVLGTLTPHWTLVGDTVNTASRMESTGQANCIHISMSTYTILKDIPKYTFSELEGIDVKGKGVMKTFFLKTVPRPKPRRHSLVAATMDDSNSSLISSTHNTHSSAGGGGGRPPTAAGNAGSRGGSGALTTLPAAAEGSPYLQARRVREAEDLRGRASPAESLHSSVGFNPHLPLARLKQQGNGPADADPQLYKCSSISSNTSMNTARETRIRMWKDDSLTSSKGGLGHMGSRKL